MKPAFFFYANPYQPRGIIAAQALAASLSRRACDVYTEPWLARQGVGRAADHVPDGVQALVAFGGDGTLLRAVSGAIAGGVPLFGVNAGTVGFLMDGSADQPEETADMLLQGRYRLAHCPLLAAQYEGKRYLALNDLSLTRGEHPGVIETTVIADGERVLGAHGDGIVIATPLGSTAYALSSGGPIVRPDVQCLTVTAIAARELLLRPVLLPLNTRVTLIAHGRDRRRLQLAIDGQTLLPVTEEAQVDIALAEEEMLLIRPLDHQFFSTLRRKQKIWNQDEEQE
ncbi:MAG: NAD(+)/NADH kinase [Clostridia bacterium]|nr:NAD(+)/NADH kinase [Clostridia bacterium]